MSIKSRIPLFGHYMEAEPDDLNYTKQPQVQLPGDILKIFLGFICAR